jgi:hypothetical protein
MKVIINQIDSGRFSILDRSQYLTIYDDEEEFEKNAVEFTEEDLLFWSEYKKANDQYIHFCIRKLAQRNMVVYNLAYKLLSVFFESGLSLASDSDLVITTQNDYFAYRLSKCLKNHCETYRGVWLEFGDFGGTLSFPSRKSAARNWLRFEVSSSEEHVEKSLLKEIQNKLILLQNEFAEVFYKR